MDLRDGKCVAQDGVICKYTANFEGPGMYASCIFIHLESLVKKTMKNIREINNTWNAQVFQIYDKFTTKWSCDQQNSELFQE